MSTATEVSMMRVAANSYLEKLRNLISLYVSEPLQRAIILEARAQIYKDEIRSMANAARTELGLLIPPEE